MKSMKESGYVDGYTDENTGDIGIEIYGRDAVLLNAPEVRLSPDTPLLTKAQDVAGAINELFQLDPGGGDDWTPPEDWLPVPEPGDYEIYLLVDIVDVSSASSTLAFVLTRPVDAGTGYDSLTIDWGDGTIQSWLGIENGGTSWSQSDTIHTYTAIGQYIVKIVASAGSCFLQRIIPNGNQASVVLIAKLGREIVVNNDSISGGTDHTQRAFYNQCRLHYVKLGGKGGLPRGLGFYNCTTLRKVEIAIPPTIIPDRTFLYCYNLKKFDFSEVTEIADRGLQYSYFPKLDLPKCTSIGTDGVMCCPITKEVTAPLCASVGNNGFIDDFGIEKAIFSENCIFGTDCFQSCFSLIPRPDGSIN